MFNNTNGICSFKTLVGLDPQKPITGSGGGFRSGSTFRGSGGGGGGGGGGPGYGWVFTKSPYIQIIIYWYLCSPGRPGGGGPSKRVFTMRDINPPRVGGGCPGGACGL